MRVILLKDVSKLGRKGDLKDVADGFGRNMLIRTGLAVLATEGAIKKAVEDSKSQKNADKRSRDAMHALRAALMERGIVIKKKANEKGELYAGVSAKEILEALKALKFPLPENLKDSMIIIDTPIKSTGVHEAKIKTSDEAALVKIEVREVK